MWSGYGQAVLMMRADDAVHAPLHGVTLVFDALFDIFLHLPIYTGTPGIICYTMPVPKKKNIIWKKKRNHQQLFCERKPASTLLSNCVACTCVWFMFPLIYSRVPTLAYSHRNFEAHTMRTPQNPGLDENLVTTWCWNPIWRAEQTPRPRHSKVLTISHFTMYIGGPKTTASQKQHWQHKQSKSERKKRQARRQARKQSTHCLSITGIGRGPGEVHARSGWHHDNLPLPFCSFFFLSFRFLPFPFLPFLAFPCLSLSFVAFPCFPFFPFPCFSFPFFLFLAFPSLSFPFLPFRSCWWIWPW